MRGIGPRSIQRVHGTGPWAQSTISLNWSRLLSDLWSRFKWRKGMWGSNLGHWLRDVWLTRFWWGGVARWAVTASLVLHSRCYGSQRFGFSSSKWSGGQGDPYSGSLMAGWAPRCLLATGTLLHSFGSA
jgi:hypothetical protein